MAFPESYFRNVESQGDWHRGETYSFEFFHYISPPDNGEYYVNQETIETVAIVCDDGLFAEDNMVANAKICYPKGYEIDQLYNDAGDAFYWVDNALDWLTVVDFSLIEDLANNAGEWYKVNVKVADNAPYGNYEIIAVHIGGRIEDLGYPIIGGIQIYDGLVPAEVYIYIAGNHTVEFTGANGVGNDCDISGSTELDKIGLITDNGVYNADENRTELYSTSYDGTAIGTFDGYILKTGDTEAPV